MSIQRLGFKVYSQECMAANNVDTVAIANNMMDSVACVAYIKSIGGKRLDVA